MAVLSYFAYMCIRPRNYELIYLNKRAVNVNPECLKFLSIKSMVLADVFLQRAKGLQLPPSPLDVTSLTQDYSVQGGFNLRAARQLGEVSDIVALRV